MKIKKKELIIIHNALLALMKESTIMWAVILDNLELTTPIYNEIMEFEKFLLTKLAKLNENGIPIVENGQAHFENEEKTKEYRDEMDAEKDKEVELEFITTKITAEFEKESHIPELISVLKNKIFIK